MIADRDNTRGPSLVGRVEALCDGFKQCFPAHAEVATPTLDRIRGPLRVAIAGRVNTGKSTLLNALVGERLAPTDATECTKVITWYEHGRSRTVTAVTVEGRRRPLPFEHVDGRLHVDLDGHRPEELSAIRVSWPSRRLENLTLVDTPGLSAVDEAAEARTRELFQSNRGDVGEIDAVIYLMRHVHSTDTTFLEAFRDTSVPYATPTNALAVLSRADQIGTAGPGSMEVAAAIARRYMADERVNSLVGDVVAVSGLLAEASATLRESDASTILELAGIGGERLHSALLSADRVSRAIDIDRTTRLLESVGVFGVRELVRAAVAGELSTAEKMAERLIVISGLEGLQERLRGQFGSRASILKARTALDRLRSAASNLAVTDVNAAAWLEREIERIESSAIELALLRAVHLVASGATLMTPDERSELERLAADGDPTERLGIGRSHPPDRIEAQALERIGAWRAVSMEPLASPARLEVADTMARAYEQIASQLNRPGDDDV